MNKTVESILKYGFALAGLVLIMIKCYFMFSTPFSRPESRRFRTEYRELFEYSLSAHDQKYWNTVVTNFESLNPKRQQILKSKLSPKEVEEFYSTIRYLKLLVQNDRVWVPQRTKDYLMYFKSKRLYDYLHQLQASVLEN